MQAATVMLSACPSLTFLRCTGSIKLSELAYLAASTLSACLRFKDFRFMGTWLPALLSHGPEVDGCVPKKQNCSDVEELDAGSSVKRSGVLRCTKLLCPGRIIVNYYLKSV